MVIWTRKFARASREDIVREGVVREGVVREGVVVR
jgi:hypothetical protein